MQIRLPKNDEPPKAAPKQRARAPRTSGLKKLWLHLWFWAPVAIILYLILYYDSHGYVAPVEVEQEDMITHALAFAALGFFLFRALHYRHHVPAVVAAGIATSGNVLVALWAGGILKAWLRGRAAHPADLLDLYFDLIGIGAVAVYMLLSAFVVGRRVRDRTRQRIIDDLARQRKP